MLLPGLFYSHVIEVYALDAMQGEYESAIKKYKNIINFDRQFVISDIHVNRIIELARKLNYLTGLTYSAKTSQVIKKHLKAAIAYRLFGQIGYSMVINKDEGVFSKSLEVLKKYKPILNIESQKGRSFDY